MGVSYIVLCSDRVVYEVCYVIDFLGFDRQLGSTSIFVSLFIHCPIPLRELASQYEVQNIP